MGWLPKKDALRDRVAQENPLPDSLLRNIATGVLANALIPEDLNLNPQTLAKQPSRAGEEAASIRHRAEERVTLIPSLYRRDTIPSASLQQHNFSAPSNVRPTDSHHIRATRYYPAPTILTVPYPAHPIFIDIPIQLAYNLAPH